ncbi:unnamed protein product [Hymenolepis diminuta]|uniref:Uncharacterized protein n=1 Tax=Hymenolepis diminuta TaxID=6216 RepID=A0A564Y9B5_HYMDI|nr:unnamed protein product [Hymenolepis diminuta]
MLTKLIESRALELSGKCGDVTGRVENKHGVCAGPSSTNQQSRSLEPSVVLYLMTKLLTHKKSNEVVNRPSPLSIFLVLTTLSIA